MVGCTGGIGRGDILGNGVGSGGGHGGRGGVACQNDTCIKGGISYGNAYLPCELGSGSGNENLTGSTAGGGIIGKLKISVIIIGFYYISIKPSIHPSVVIF